MDLGLRSDQLSLQVNAYQNAAEDSGRKTLTLFPMMEDHLIIQKYSKHKKAQEMSISETLCIQKISPFKAE